MAGPTLRIEAPTRTPRAGGLSKVAEFRANEEIGNAEGLVYISDGCVFPRTEESRCFAAATVADKTFDGIETIDGIATPFTIYAGVGCSINPDPDFFERARLQFNEGRDRVLEEILGVWADGGTALDAGESVAWSIAIVEQELDKSYLGRGVIIMSRLDAVLADAAGALKAGPDGFPVTVNGTPVLASGVIEPGTVYGTGAIAVEHTQTLEREAVDWETNNHYALAEAMFAFAVDCDFRVKSAITA